MSAACSPAELDRLRQVIESRLGLHILDDRVDELVTFASRRMQALGLVDASTYLGRLISPATSRAELQELAEHLTVGETYFFRHGEQFRAMAEVALSDRLRARADLRVLRVLSAGCASGEEAYTLAILIQEHIPDGSRWRLEIHGVDINPAALRKAARAVYSSWSLRDSPREVRERYFRFDGREYALDERIRTAVTFAEGNLLDGDDPRWSAGSFDIIFCRNVFIYFSAEAIRAALAHLTTALAPGGFLFLGHAENLRGLTRRFHLRHTHGTFYYQKIDGEASPSPREPPEHGARTPVDATASNQTWVEAIQRATERIAALSASVALPGPTWDRTLVLSLLEQERFGDASAALAALSPAASEDPDAQLLLAVLHTNRRELEHARRVCEKLLAQDELNAGAHYLMALCCEQAGDLSGATHHDQIAAHLDASFAMPRFHMGLIARRAGDGDRAAAELAVALELFEREESARILLFGGGFNREALMRMCRPQEVSP